MIRPKPNTWSKDYIAACLFYCPASDKRCWGNDQKPLLDHRLTQNTTSNQKSWSGFLRNDMLRSAFNAAYKDSWNRGMKALMDAPREIGDMGPGYDWRHHTPTTRNDMLELLRSNEAVDIATKGNLVEVVGSMFK